MNEYYFPFHVHSHLSNPTMIDSCSSIDDYVEKAKELNIKTFAFSEHGNVFEHTKKKRLFEEAGIKFVFGIEAYLTTTLEEKKREAFHIGLYAKNFEGYKEINKLILKSYDKKTNNFYFRPRISMDELFNTSDNIIVTTACLGSPIWQFLKNKDEVNLKKIMSWLVKNKHRTFLEVQYHAHEEQKQYNKWLWDFSKKHSVRLIAGTDTHAHSKYSAECRHMLQKAKRIQFTDEDSFDLVLKDYDGLVKAFEDQNALPKEVILEAIENTNVMADMIEDYQINKDFKYPDIYENPKSEILKIVKERLVKEIKSGFIDIKKKDVYVERIKSEIKILEKLDMLSFILYQSEITGFGRGKGFPIGPGRGSVGGSLIAYLLGITDLDAIEYGTYMERFANPHRTGSLADIDSDFKGSDRHDIFEFIEGKSGENKHARIITFGVFKNLSTIDELGRALDLPLDEVKEIKKQFSEADENEDKVAMKKLKEKYKDLFYYFDGIKGTVASRGLHAAGIATCPMTLHDNYSLIKDYDDNGEEMIITSMSMKEIDGNGITKFDILGLNNLAIIDDACKLAGIPYPTSKTIDLHDENVWNDLTKTNIGIFQFEADYVLKYIQKYKPTNIEELSFLNALLRPSANSFREQALERKINEMPIPELNEMLKETNSWIVYQEQLMNMLTYCGFDLAEADLVRRGIAKKVGTEQFVPRIREGFIKNATENYGLSLEDAKKTSEEFVKIIQDSASYGFNKSHSVAYSFISYYCAYLRYYYPLEFSASLLNNAGTEDDIVNANKLLKMKNITLNPIQFRYSKAGYHIDKENNSIYKGISSLKYLNVKVAEELYDLRDITYNDFIDVLNDLNEKTSINSRQLDILIKLDFFSEFGGSQKLLDIVRIYDKLYKVKQIKKDKMNELRGFGLTYSIAEKYSEKETEKLLKELDNVGMVKEIVSSIEDKSISLKERLQAEIDYMGYISYTNDKINYGIYYVTDYKVYSNKRKPYFTIYELRTGKSQKTKIKDEKLFMSKPFKKSNILKIDYADGFKNMPKYKNVDGKWVKSGETEKVVVRYDIYV